MSRGAALAALCAVVLLAFHPLWMRGQTTSAALAARDLPVADPAAARLEEAELELAARAIVDGSPASWSLHRGLGTPLGDLALPGMLHPLRAVLLGGEPDFDLLHLLRALVAATGAFVLATRLGCRPVGGLVCGVAFGLSAPIFRQLCAPALDGAVLLPWLLVAADRAALARGPASLSLLAATALFVVAGGGARFLPAAALSLLGLAAARRRSWPVGGTAAVGWACLAALGVGALAWLPVALAGAAPSTGRPPPGVAELLAGVLVSDPFGARGPALACAASGLALLLAWLGTAGSGRVALGLAAFALVAGGASGAGALGWLALPATLFIALAAGRGAGMVGVTPAARCAALARAMLIALGVGVVFGLAVGGFRGQVEVAVRAAALGGLWLVVARRPQKLAVLVAALLSFEHLGSRPLSWAPAVAAERWAGVGALRAAGEPRGLRFVSTALRPTPHDCVRSGLQDARPPLARTSARLAAFVARCVPELADLRALPPPGRARLLDLLNVRALVREGAAAEPRIEPREPLPFAFFPRRVEAVGDFDEALDRVAGAEFDAAELSVLEADDLRTTAGPGAGSAGFATRERKSADDGSIELNVQAREGAYLVVSLEPTPGLRVALDGQPAPVLPADAVCSAVFVPRGRHRLEIDCAIDPTGVCLWIALLSAAGFGVLIYRRARNPVPPIDPFSAPLQDTPPAPPGAPGGDAVATG